MNKEERLKDYLEGFISQYNFVGNDKIEHSLNEDIKEILEENKQLRKINEEHRILNGELREENKKLKDKLNCDLEWSFKYDELKERIDKAIEYIEKQQNYPYPTLLNEDKLLEILKGENNE